MQMTESRNIGVIEYKTRIKYRDVRDMTEDKRNYLMPFGSPTHS